MANEKEARTPVEDRPQERAPSGCCPPRAMVWIDAESQQIFVENSMQQRTRLDVRAAIAQATTTSPSPGMVQHGTGDSELEDTVLKSQGKVYRTDRYTVHWRAEGQCRPLEVRLSVGGAVAYRAECLPEEGRVVLSRSYLMEPPGYDPDGADYLRADVEVRDCSGLSISCWNQIPRP